MKINSTPDVPVIYENPKYPLPDGARWLSKDNRDCVRWYKGEPTISRAIAGAWEIERVTDNQPLTGYDIPGPWQDSLRRIVRLSDPAYYCAENQFTDDEGFLPHDGGPMPEWVRGKAVFAIDRNGLPCRGICNWRQIDSYCIVGEQEAEVTDADSHVGKVHPEDRRREQELSQEQEDVEEGLALLRKHSWDLYEKSGASENGDDPEQFASGNPVPFVEKPRSPSDATYPREAVQRAYEHGYRDGVDDTPGGPPDERRHRNELAARTLTPVPGMDDFMHDVLREARRRRYQELLVLEDVRDPESQITKPALKHLFDMADAMIEQEDSE